MRPSLIAWFFFAALIFSCGDIFAAGSDNDLTNFSLPLWDKTFTVRTAVGYDDNISLSHYSPQSSPFFQGGADISLIRLPENGWQLFFLLTGDDWYYWNDPAISHQDLWMAAADIRKNFDDNLTFGLTSFYAYENQVVDLSSEEDIQSPPTNVIGNTITVQPSLRWDFQTNYWAKFELDAMRQFFGAPAYSFTRFGPKFEVGRNYGNRSELSLSYEPYWQFYDNEPETDSAGDELPGTTRRDFRQHVELDDRHYFDKARHWRATTKAYFEYSQDNSAGFFNYYLYGGAEEIHYENKKWDITGRADLSRYDYPVQVVSVDDQDKWNMTDLTLKLHAERTLTKWLKVFGEYQYEHSFSDRLTEDYQANTVSAGLEWVF